MAPLLIFQPPPGSGRTGVERIVFFKAHISGYTKRDGTFVKPHEDSRMIHRDALGIPNPKAQVAGWGGSFGNHEYYLVLSTAPGVSGRRFSSLDEAEKVLSSEGWTVTGRKKDGYNKDILEIEHGETASELNRRESADELKWKGAKPVFVRYGKLPPGGRSRNHADGTWEPGVSVFRGEAIPSGEARAIPSHNYQLGSLLSLQGAGLPLYIVEGEETGVGSDGEPVLTNARIVREVGKKRAARGR